MRYKLTDENGQTYGGCEWGPGVSHSAPGTGGLCSDGWIHVYDSPWVAAMINPCHADFENPRLWECEVSGNELNDIRDAKLVLECDLGCGIGGGGIGGGMGMGSGKECM